MISQERISENNERILLNIVDSILFQPVDIARQIVESHTAEEVIGGKVYYDFVPSQHKTTLARIFVCDIDVVASGTYTATAVII